MNDSKARILLCGTVLITATALSSCASGSDNPALCSSLDSLKSSVAGLTDIQINGDTLANVQDTLDQVQSDLRQVKDDASDEYSLEVDAVDQATSELNSNLDDAVTTPSVEAASAVATSVRAVGTSLNSLADAVKNTC